MRSRMRLTISGGLIGTLFFLATVSSAQVKASTSSHGYYYLFEDDALNAGGFDASEATIRVRPQAARATLIRPRISFIPAMLRSVEKL